MKMYRIIFAVVTTFLATTAYTANNVAIITALEGNVIRISNIQAESRPIDAFMKLKIGDNLDISRNSSMRILYFDNGRQENWIGPGKLSITQNESIGTGLSVSQVKQIPLLIVQQIARTPTLDSQERAGVMRIRGNLNNTQKEIERITAKYQEMRLDFPQNDLNPEIYLLAGMFELKQYNRVADILNNLQQEYPKNPQVKVLVDFYNRVLPN